MIIPDWPLPKHIVAAVSTREGGVSVGPYQSLNTAQHVGDDPACVEENRRRLLAGLRLANSPLWLTQVHGTQVVEAGMAAAGCEADAVYSVTAGEPCIIQTADCLPVLFCDRDGRQVAAAHAGWAGLQAGVLEQTLATFPDPSVVYAWLGPAISQPHFEVGPEVRAGFLEAAAPGNKEQTLAAFVPSGRPDHWLADLYQLARLRLQPKGVTVLGGGLCTFADKQRFFSYRRDRVTGRMASLIYIKP